MPGFHSCDLCKTGLPMEDRLGKCAACLGPEHAKEALVNRNSWLPSILIKERGLHPYLTALCQGRAGKLHVGLLPLPLAFLHLLLLPLLRRGGERATGLRSESSEQLDKLWAVVSQQGIELAELLHERTAPPSPIAPLEQQGVADAEWQQEDLLSIAASEEMDNQEFPSKEGNSDSAIPVAGR
ncbi:UNVERIFIED_CONTAM: hypothetical protein FKN15_014631 [Acipenser sinensis]